MSEDWPDEPVKVTDESMEEFVNKYPTSVIDCWAEWCGPCKMVEPVLEDLAEEMKGEVAFGKLNVDENPENSSKYGITSIPSLLIFKDGELEDKLIGAMPKDALKKELQDFI